MPKDYKSRDTRRPKRRHGGGSCFFWFLTGALLGALGVAVAWMMEGLEKPPENVTTEAPAQAAQPPLPSPRFDYHHILPDMEVVVPDDESDDKRPPALPPPLPKEPEAPETASTKEKPQSTPAQTTPPAKPSQADSGSGGTYMLQVASFKRQADAERLKAQLALLGLSSSIQRVTVNGGQTYHRVRSGPYQGGAALNKARTLIAGQGMKAMVIKIRQ